MSDPSHNTSSDASNAPSSSRNIAIPEPISSNNEQRWIREGGARSNAYAVVVGIDRYHDASIKDLSFAVADARAFHDVLVDPMAGCFDPAHVTLLLDQEATQRNIRSAIGTQLRRRANEDDTVVVYFAGHGAPEIDPDARSVDGMRKYLIPHDAEMDDLFASAISMDEIQEYFGRLASKQIVFFIDSCYSGMAGGRTFVNQSYQTRAQLTNQFLDQVAGEGRAVITACDANEVSLETPKLGHGLFTHYLVEGLRGEADSDSDGLVSSDELYRYVYDNVVRHARQMGGSMHPVRKGYVRGAVHLARTAKRSGAAVDSAATTDLSSGREPGSGVALEQSFLQRLLQFNHTWASYGLAAVFVLMMFLVTWGAYTMFSLNKRSLPSAEASAGLSVSSATRPRLVLLPLRFQGEPAFSETQASGLLFSITSELISLKAVRDEYAIVPASMVQSENISRTRQADSTFSAQQVVVSSMSVQQEQWQLILDVIDPRTMEGIASTEVLLPAKDFDVLRSRMIEEVAQLIGVELTEESTATLASQRPTTPGHTSSIYKGSGTWRH